MSELERASGVAYALDKVPDPLRKYKREAYDPQLLSLGPLHKDRLISLMLGRHFKNHCAASLGDTVIHNLKKKLQPDEMPQRLQAFYGLTEPFDTAQQETLAMDSVFLLCFLDYILRQSEPRGVSTVVSHGLGCDTDAERSVSVKGPDNVFRGFDYVEGGLMCDVVMVENQLALTVVKAAFAEAVEAHHFSHHKSVDDMLSRAVLKLSPFAFHQIQLQNMQSSIVRQLDQDQNPRPLRCPAAGSEHLLGMLREQLADVLTVNVWQQQDTTQKSYSWLSRLRYRADDAVAAVMGVFIKHPAQRDNHDFVEAYNAESLSKAGVRFRAFSQQHQRIHLDKQSGTLYLPRVTMSHVYTEVLLRNVMALEFNDAAAEHRPVTTYVELMDCLIDSADDVGLLRHGHVIVRDSLMLKDSDIARMWHDMCRPYFTGRLEPPSPLKEELQEVLIKNFYRSKLRSILKEFRDTYFSRPWTAVAMLVGILLVGADVIQTFCALSPKCKGN